MEIAIAKYIREEGEILHETSSGSIKDNKETKLLEEKDEDPNNASHKGSKNQVKKLFC